MKTLLFSIVVSVLASQAVFGQSSEGKRSPGGVRLFSLSGKGGWKLFPGPEEKPKLDGPSLARVELPPLSPPTNSVQAEIVLTPTNAIRETSSANTTNQPPRVPTL